MTRRVRVLWLVKGLGRGGAEQLLVGSVAYLDRKAFDVEVAYVLPYKDALVPALREQGVTVHCLGDTGPPAVGWVLALGRLLRTARFDVVHTHMPLPAAAARLLTGQARLVHTEHNVWGRYKAPTRWANALTYRRNHAVLAVSQGVADSVVPGRLRTGVAVEVLHHGIDPATVRRGAGARAAARELLGLADSDRVVGTVANFTPKKDQRTLLAAVAQLPDVRLIIAGTGPLEAELRAEAERLGVEVRWLGMRDDVPALLPVFDVFCLSSLHEGLPISLVEAMAAGVAPVCTEVGGIGEVLTDGADGLLVPAADPVALADALGRVLDDDALRERLGAAAAERSKAFDIGAATRRIQEVYREVLSAG